MQYAAFILIVLVQGIRCQKNCTTRTNDKMDFCVTSCNSTQSNCSGNSACMCDGDCGYSCVSRDLRCPRPGSIDHGRVRYKQDTFGSIARYKCFEPYQLVGPRRRTCRGNGNWDGKKPVCKVICQDPGNIQHGKKYHDGFESGKKVKYRCSPGFTIQGRGTLTCTRTGRWDRVKPSCTCARTNKRAYRYCQKACDPNRNTCKGNKECICDGDCGYSCVPKGLSCGRPQQIQNGRRQHSSTRLSSSVKYQCNKPYELIGSSVRTCRGIREWDGVQPQCKIVCQDPGAIEFGTKEVSGMRDEKGYLTVGDKVKYNCFPNYNMEGSMLLTCDARGRWDNPKPNCTLPSCGPPPIPSNAELMRSRREKTSFRFNDRVMLRCKSGYFATGILLLTCGSKGWSGLSFRCLPKSCGDPGTPTNGKIKSYIFTFKSKVYFECNYGYRLLGDEYRQCQSNQKWSGQMPSCEQIDCGDLPTPDKAEKVMQTHTRVGGFVSFKCKERGYEIIGSEMRDCLETGLWSGITTSCKIISCGDPGTPLNGKKINVKINFNFGGSVEFACNDNYTMAGNRVIQCEEDKDWNLPIPRCFAPCSDPGVPGSGSRIGDDFRHDRSVSFTCQEGFELEGDKTITCLDGRWSGERPQCEVVSCGDPGTPSHGRKKKVTSFTYGGIVRFKCDKDYISRGKSKLKCQANKKWNGELPQCLAPCLDPGQLLHGRIIGDNFTHDSLVKFQCLSGFSLKGSPAMRCNNGAWNTTKPTCTDCDGGKPLGMQSGAIPDSAIKASSQRDQQHSAHHGRLGGNSFWCPKNERKTGYIEIDLPKEYKITAVSIEVQDRIKIGIALFALFYSKQLQFHAEKPLSRSGEKRIVLAQPMIAKKIRIVLSRQRRVTTSVCLRAEVYGCEIPRGCVMPGSAVLGLIDGRYWKGKLGMSDCDQFEFVYSFGLRSLRKTDFFPDEIPDPDELSEGTLVLVKDAKSDLFGDGKIVQIGDSLYMEPKDGAVRRVNVKELRVKKEPKFCPP